MAAPTHSHTAPGPYAPPQRPNAPHAVSHGTNYAASYAQQPYAPEPAPFHQPAQAPHAGAVPFSKRPIFTPYVLAWSAVGILATGYLAIAGLAPELLERGAADPSFIADPQSNQGQRAAARLAADVNALKDSIAAVQLDLAKVKTDVAGQNARDKALSAQLVALERRLGAAQGNAVEATEPASPQTGKPRSASAPTSNTEPNEQADAAPAEAPAAAKARTSGAPTQPKLVNAEASVLAAPGLTLENPIELQPQPGPAAIETASTAAAGARAGAKAVKPAAAAAAAKTAAATAAATVLDTDAAAATTDGEVIDLGTPVVTSAAKSMGVQISSGASVDSLRLSWSLLADRHGDALKNLEARYIARGDVESPTYDLIAGPLKSKGDAQRVCKSLMAKGVPCKVGDFLGEAL